MNITEDELLKIAASAEKSSEHPLGEAIVKNGEEKNLGFYKVDKFNGYTRSWNRSNNR